MGEVGHNCLPKEKGGLGVRGLASFYRALLGKWRWNLDGQRFWSRSMGHGET